jgi:hypothetical protein
MILDAMTDMDCYKCVYFPSSFAPVAANKSTANREEIFGPVLTIVKVDTRDKAIALINENKCSSFSSFCLFLYHGSIFRLYRR